MSDQKNYQTNSNSQPQQPQQPAQQPKKKHTALIVVIVILIVLIVGGMVSCAACSSALNDAVEGSKADTVENSTADDTQDEAEDTQENASDTEQSSAVRLYKKGGITIKATEKGEDWLAPYYTIAITNKGKHNINVSIDDVSVDGMMVDTWFYEDVAKGKTTTERLDLSGSDLELSDVKNVEGTIKITNAKTYSIIDTATFTIK